MTMLPLVSRVSPTATGKRKSKRRRPSPALPTGREPMAPQRGNETLAQGNALGPAMRQPKRPARAKASPSDSPGQKADGYAYALTGRYHAMPPKPRAVPWASIYCPFGAQHPPCFCSTAVFLLFSFLSPSCPPVCDTASRPCGRIMKSTPT